MTLDGSKLKDSRTDRGTYTLSNCCGNTELTGKTEIKASTEETDPSFAFDTDEKTGYTKPGVTVNGADVVITGDVELSGGDLTLTAGTLTGALKGDKGNGSVTKVADFTATAPDGYGWDKDNKLIKAEAELDGAAYATLADAVAAAQDGDEIKLLDNVTLTEQLEINKAIILNGNGKTVTRTPNTGAAYTRAGILVNGVAATVKNLTVSGPNTSTSGWDSGEYGIKFYQANGAALSDVTVTGANAGIQVNGGKVTMTGNVNVSGNEFGGIEVCKKGTLDISGATLKNDTEDAANNANPVLWNDGDGKVENMGTITGSGSLNKKLTDDTTKDHYFLSGTPEAEIDGQKYLLLTDALKDAKDGDTIRLKCDLTLTDEILITKAITLDGDGKKITATGISGKSAILVNGAAATVKNLTVIGPNTTPRSGNSGWDNGEYGIKFYQADGAKLNNVTVKNANAGIQVNGGSVTMTGTIDVSGNEWGGIELCHGGKLDISGATLKNDGETDANPVLWNDDTKGEITFSTSQMLYVKAADNTKDHYYLSGDATVTNDSGTVGYRTLEEALNAAQDGDTVTLLKDITTEGFTVPDGVTLDLGGKTVTPATAPNFKGIINNGDIVIYQVNADQLDYLLYDAVMGTVGHYIAGEEISYNSSKVVVPKDSIIIAAVYDGIQDLGFNLNHAADGSFVAWALPVKADTYVTVNGTLKLTDNLDIKGDMMCTTLLNPDDKDIKVADGSQFIVTDLKSAVDGAKKAITDAAGNTPSDAVKAIVEEYNGTNDAAGKIDKKADPTGINSTNSVDAAKTEIEKLKAEALFKVYRQQEAEELIAEYGEGSEKVRTILDSANSILAVNYDPANSLEDNKTAVDNAVEALKEALDLQIAKEEAAAAIEEAAGQPEFRTETMNAIVDEFLNSETGSITNATDIEQINTVLLPDALARIEKQHQLDCRYEEKLPISGSENVKLYLNGKYVGDVSIHEVRGGYAIETADGFLCFRNGRFYKSETEMFAWRYNGVGFCVTQDTAAGKGALVRLVDLIVSLIRTDGWWYESYTTYYLSSLNGVSTLPVKAELSHDVYGKGGHDYGPWISNGDGTHTRYCTNCDNGKQTATCVYDQPGDKCVCGAINPNVYNVNASVSKATRKVLFITQYTYTIKPDVHGATVRKVEYSLDGGIVWLNVTSFILPNNNFSYRFRITDSTGHVTYFTVKNGTNVTKK